MRFVLSIAQFVLKYNHFSYYFGHNPTLHDIVLLDLAISPKKGILSNSLFTLYHKNAVNYETYKMTLYVSKKHTTIFLILRTYRLEFTTQISRELQNGQMLRHHMCVHTAYRYPASKNAK